MAVEFLTYEGYRDAAVQVLKYDESLQRRSNWRSYDIRWAYHLRAIEIIKSSGVSQPQSVLEMGTAGVQLVVGGHTIDYDQKWQFPGANPTYLHDARSLPWPVADKQYKWFVALRVFHHLQPVQFECFREAVRIAENVLILVPLPTPDKPKKGITVCQFCEWNGGTPPKLMERTNRYGYMYHWDEEALGAR